MAYQFFIHRVPGKSLADGFSEVCTPHEANVAHRMSPDQAKLREIFPHLFGLKLSWLPSGSFARARALTAGSGPVRDAPSTTERSSL